MSEFMFLFRAPLAEAEERMGTPEAAQKSMQAWLGWLRELEANGALKNPGQPLQRTGKVVRAKKLVTDGPYAETKDVVLGFLTVEARDADHAAELSMSCPILQGTGCVEVRPIAAM